MVDGILYTPTPGRKVVALDAATGAVRWTWGPAKEGPGRGRARQRGLVYWENEEGGERRLFTGVAGVLFALDPASGKVINDFGEEVPADEWYVEDASWEHSLPLQGEPWLEESWTEADCQADAWTEQAWSGPSKASPATTAAPGGAELGELKICHFEMSIDSWQSDKTDPTYRTITFGIDSGACRTVVPTTHPAARGYRVHRDDRVGD